MKAAHAQGMAMLDAPENEWAYDLFQLYYDSKDHLHLRPSDISPATRTALRCIRQGSGGRLGNAPLL